MMNVHLLTALLFSFSWISVSVSEFYTVEVQSGEQVTLMCTNCSSGVGHIVWSRMNSRPNITCISSMQSSDGNVSFCDGFENGRFDMTSNTTTLFLQIKQVDLSDSGLYFCGANSIINNNNYNYKPLIDSATYLKVQEESVKPLPLLSVILGVLIIFLILIIIALVVKMRKLHICTYLKEEEQTPHLSENQNQASGDVNYAALNFGEPKIKRNRRPVRAEPVVYTAVK